MLKAVNIQPVYGCGCERTMAELDKRSVEEIRNNVDYWAENLHTNAREWQSIKGGAWSKLPPPPKALCRRAILWACDAVEENSELTGTNPGD